MARINPFSAQNQYQLRPMLFTIFLTTTLPHVFEIPTWVTIVMTCITVWSFFVIRQITRPAPPWLLGLTSLVFTVTVYAQFRTLLGPDSATPLLLLLAALKMQEIRKLRDAIIFLFICTLIVMYYLLYSQTLLATVYMIANLILIATAFMVIHSPPDKVKEVIRSSPRLVTKDLLLSLPLFLAFFFLFPRFSTPWGRYFSEPKGSVGFSDFVRPGDFAKLVESDDPAFRVSFPENIQTRMVARANQFYWRGVSLDQTDGWGWGHHPTKDDNLPVAVEPLQTHSPTNRIFQYYLTLEPKYDRQMFTLESTRSLDWVRPDQHNPILKLKDNVYKTAWPNIARVQYVGQALEIGQREILDKNQKQIFTRLPPAFSEKARELAKTLTKNQASVGEKVQKILSYYATMGFRYSLSTPEMPNIDSFLFEQKVGFCEHFAASFALLMRSVGVPARMIVGFQGGEMNDFANYILVRDKDAHTWDEVYDDKLGWIRVDPTSVIGRTRVSLGRLEAKTYAEHNLLAYAYHSGQMLFDSVNSRYTSYMMNYDFDQQRKVLGFGENPSFKRYQIFFLLLLAVAASVFLINLRLKSATRAKVTPARNLYDQLLLKLKTYDLVCDSTEGPADFAERAAVKLPEKSEMIYDLVGQYILWEYKANLPTSKESAQFIKKLRAL